MTRKAGSCLLLIAICAVAQDGFAASKTVDVALVVTDQPIDGNLKDRILQQNNEISSTTKIVYFTGSVKLFRDDPDNMSMAIIARYDSEKGTAYLENQHVTVAGKTRGVDYVLLKLYGSSVADPGKGGGADSVPAPKRSGSSREIHLKGSTFCARIPSDFEQGNTRTTRDGKGARASIALQTVFQSAEDPIRVHIFSEAYVRPDASTKFDVQLACVQRVAELTSANIVPDRVSPDREACTISYVDNDGHFFDWLMRVAADEHEIYKIAVESMPTSSGTRTKLGEISKAILGSVGPCR